MKRICTLMASLCLLVAAQNLYAQTVTISSSFPSPSPSPGFGGIDSVKASNGFTSSNTSANSFNVYPKGTSSGITTIVSPTLQYPTDQTQVYFKYNFTIANTPGGSTPTATITLAYGSTTITFPATSFNIASGGGDYYFTLNLGTTLPALTNFTISLKMNVPSSDKAVTAETFSSNAPMNVNATLPVSFTAFSAQKSTRGVALTWNVASEENVAAYEVQRSSNGSDFTKIGSVNATQSSSYNFTDNSPVELAYYRIKSIDADGKYKYSSIVALKGPQSNVVLKAFPMPVQNQLTIQHGSVASNSKIEVMSVDGRLVKSVSISAGAQETRVDFSNQKPGVYLARFNSGDGQSQTLKIIKQ